MLKLFLVKRPPHVIPTAGKRLVMEMVIVTETETRARIIANGFTSGSEIGMWMREATCLELGSANPSARPGVISIDYGSGQ